MLHKDNISSQKCTWERKMKDKMMKLGAISNDLPFPSSAPLTSPFLLSHRVSSFISLSLSPLFASCTSVCFLSQRRSATAPCVRCKKVTLSQILRPSGSRYESPPPQFSGGPCSIMKPVGWRRDTRSEIGWRLWGREWAEQEARLTLSLWWRALGEMNVLTVERERRARLLVALVSRG